MEILYNTQLFGYSIKDDHDLDLSEKKWEHLFEYMEGLTNHFYFIGKRLNYVDNKLKSKISIAAEEQGIYDLDINHSTFFKIKASNFFINKSVLFYLWNIFENSYIICTTNLIDGFKIERIIASKYHDERLAALDDFFILFKNLESDVLWIQTSFDGKALEQVFQKLNTS